MAFSPDSALNLLTRAHKQNRLAHAYLISGPVGSGKRTLAANLTSLVNGTPAEDVFSTRARDIYLAEPESKSRRILADQVRDLEHSLQMRSGSGGRKVAIIAEADRLQPQAANAFLKTLEEPPDHSLLLLLSALPEALPDTIISRCVPIPLAQGDVASPAEEAELIKLLRDIAREKTWNLQTAYGLAGGLQRLLAQVREEIKETNAAAEKREEVRYKNATDGRWLADREDYYKALTESQYLRRRARLVETIFSWWTDVLRTRSNVADLNIPSLAKETKAVAARFETAEVLRRIRRLEELRDHLDRNIQEALAIEVAFVRIFGS